MIFLDDKVHRDLYDLANQILLLNNIDVSSIDLYQFIDKNLKKEYEVYLIKNGSQKFVIKKMDFDELDNYTKYLKGKGFPIIDFYKNYIKIQDNEIIALMDYFPGEHIGHQSGETLNFAAIAIADIHSYYWSEEEKSNSGYEYLPDHYVEFPVIKEKIEAILKRYQKAPTTLINDDLLPINILSHKDEIKIIDWRHLKRAPYFQDLSRLIAHCDGNDEEWFDKKSIQQIIETYYNRLTSNGVSIDFKQYSEDILYGIILQLADSEFRCRKTHKNISKLYLKKINSII